MVRSARTWLSAVCRVSPAWAVTRLDREAVGRDGEQYAWTRLVVNEISDGLLASMCEFELEDEEAAFAYAEERMLAASSRLAVTNRASESTEAGWRAMQVHDVDVAEGIAVTIDYAVALNRGDFGTLFGELTTADMRVENRSRSFFPDRGAAELRGSLEELGVISTLRPRNRHSLTPRSVCGPRMINLARRASRPADLSRCA
jgi:hypothetical protein